jgi:hypothetical protein
LVITLAWFAGSSAAMVRSHVRQVASGCRQERATPDQDTHEAPP